MSPSVLDLTGTRKPIKGIRFVVSEIGAEKLNTLHPKAEVKKGDVLVYPNYENLDARALGTIWMNAERTNGGMQVSYSDDLFDSIVNPTNRGERK